MIIAAETDEEAMAKWKHYNDGVDIDAIAWLADQGAADKHQHRPPTSASSPRPKGR